MDRERKNDNSERTSIDMAHLKPLSKNEPFSYLPNVPWDAWQKCLDAVEKYDNNQCRDWKEDIDTLLVFIGLFTAVVTAFTTESYQWLQPDPLDTNNQLLYIISRQLSGVNTTLPQNPSEPLVFIPDAASIRVNCFWFASISLSLFAALIGITCKQWLREFQRDAAVSNERAIAFRQLRFDGLQYWRVPQIVEAPVLLLQGALFLFFAGLLDLLWSKIRNTAVALPSTLIAGLALLFTIGTTLAPAIDLLSTRIQDLADVAKEVGRPPCAYRSPQTWVFVSVCMVVRGYIYRNIRSRHFRVYMNFSSWLDIDRYWVDRTLTPQILASHHYCATGLSWIFNNVSFDAGMVRSVVFCIQDIINRTPWIRKSGSLSEIVHSDGQSLEISLLKKLRRHRSPDYECLVELSVRAASGAPYLDALSKCHELTTDLKVALWHQLHRRAGASPMGSQTAAEILVSGLRHPLGDLEPQSLSRRLYRLYQEGQRPDWDLRAASYDHLHKAVQLADVLSPAFIVLYKVMLLCHKPRVWDGIARLTRLVSARAGLPPDHLDKYIPGYPDFCFKDIDWPSFDMESFLTASVPSPTDEMVPKPEATVRNVRLHCDDGIDDKDGPSRCSDSDADQLESHSSNDEPRPIVSQNSEFANG